MSLQDDLFDIFEVLSDDDKEIFDRIVKVLCELERDNANLSEENTNLRKVLRLLNAIV